MLLLIRDFYTKKAPVIIQRTDDAVVPPHFVRISQAGPLRVQKYPCAVTGASAAAYLKYSFGAELTKRISDISFPLARSVRQLSQGSGYAYLIFGHRLYFLIYKVYIILIILSSFFVYFN